MEFSYKCHDYFLHLLKRDKIDVLQDSFLNFRVEKSYRYYIIKTWLNRNRTEIILFALIGNREQSSVHYRVVTKLCRIVSRVSCSRHWQCLLSYITMSGSGLKILIQNQLLSVACTVLFVFFRSKIYFLNIMTVRFASEGPLACNKHKPNVCYIQHTLL